MIAWLKDCRFGCKLLVVLVASLGMTLNAQAQTEVVAKLPSVAEANDDCQVHVIGIYSPVDSNHDDRTYVKIENTGKPMIVVLCGYFGAQWNVSVAPGAEIREIIVSGWFNHSLVGAPESIPVKMIIGSPLKLKGKPSKDYFWAYSWHTEQGREMREKVKALTGRGIDTFQGVYQGKRFVIDGRRGSSPGDAEKSESDADATDTEESLSQSEQENPAMVEKHVRQLFALDMQKTQQRIATAEQELTRIKARFAARQQAAERIIQDRIAALVKMDSDAPAAVEVSDPTGQGWQLWRQRDWEAASKMFKIAVQRTPDSGRAWNGLGWSEIHLGNYESAKTAFIRALEIEPENGGARNGLGQVFLASGDLESAEKELLRATTEIIKEAGEANVVKQDVTASWLGLVEVYLKQKDYDAAKSWAERYLKHKPDDERMKSLLDRATTSHEEPF